MMPAKFKASVAQPATLVGAACLLATDAFIVFKRPLSNMGEAVKFPMRAHRKYFQVLNAVVSFH